MPYKKREPVTSICEYCKSEFESLHLRRRFCCDSCRVLSATERLEGSSKSKKNALSFGHTVAAAAVGGLAADAAVAVGKSIIGHKSPEMKGIEELKTLLKTHQDLSGSETTVTTGEVVTIVYEGRQIALRQCKLNDTYRWLGERDGTAFIFRLQAGRFEMDAYRPRGKNEFLKPINPLLA